VHFWIETELDFCLVSLVGATNVGGIGSPFVQGLSQFLKSTQAKLWELDDAVEKGAELGWFAMGSSVVVLAGPGLLPSLQEVQLPRAVLVRSDF
jgi:phosphatidylserine decarboxylase